MEALVNRADELKGVEIIHGMSPGPNAYVAPEYQGIFHHTSLFIGPKTRKAYAEKRIDYIGGTTFSRWPDLFAKNPDLNPHWAFIQVSEPDEEGMCSFGNACCFSEPAARTADRIIAQINPKMPTLGGKKISLDKIDYIVPAESGLYTIGRAEIDARTQTIADYVAELVEDGATIQLGFGGTINALAAELKDKRGLGIHTEAMSDAAMELLRCGAADNSRKSLHRGKTVTCFTMGSHALYDFVDDNPTILHKALSYTNDLSVLAANRGMTSINAALQVDLTGQCASESVGPRQISGSGGQVDTAVGAQMAPGGKSVITLRSTYSAKDPDTGERRLQSRILPVLPEGAVVTLTRSNTHFVATEYGAVCLRGLTVPQRAKALISIAHPDFRDWLEEEFHRIYRL